MPIGGGSGGLMGTWNLPLQSENIFYTNNYGKTILVSVTITGTKHSTISTTASSFVSGDQIQQQNFSADVSGEIYSMLFVFTVPSAATYGVFGSFPFPPSGLIWAEFY